MLIHKDGKTNLEQLDARSDEAGKWIAKQKISKVLMNPPYENKYGCLAILENVLNHVPPHTSCAFILPDKKLEKAQKGCVTRILKHHCLRKIIKLPEDLFFNIGITTSIFIFESGIPQSDKEIFCCYMDSDGLVTVKNKGRHDVYNRWESIENRWIDIVSKQSGDESCQWIKPAEHLSYQLPQSPFEIFDEDFRETALDYMLFKNSVDSKGFKEHLLNRILFSSDITDNNTSVLISIEKGVHNRGKN